MTILTILFKQGDDTCCWKCRDCPSYNVRPDEFHCEECPQGEYPNEDRTECLPIPETYIDYKNPLAIGALTVSGFGKWIKNSRLNKQRGFFLHFLCAFSFLHLMSCFICITCWHIIVYYSFPLEAHLPRIPEHKTFKGSFVLH